MDKQDSFASGREALIPKGDAARQAIDSLRGYAYQVTAAALAWLDVDATSKIYLEVAEDYAVVAADAVSAVQVKDTRASGKVTLNTQSVRDALSSFVKLTALNPSVDVHLRYFTTAEIGKEKALQDRPGGASGLEHWRSVAKGADVTQLRKILDSDRFPDPVREFVRSREDDELRRDLFRKIHWECGKPDLASLRKEFLDRLIVVGRDNFNILGPDAVRISTILLHHVLEKSIEGSVDDRVLTRADLISVIDSASTVSLPIAMWRELSSASSSLLAPMVEGAEGGSPVTFSLPAWLADSSDLPTAKRAVPRPEIERTIESVLRTYGVCFVVGPSGVGKSSVARMIAERVGKKCFVVDFRDAGVEETQDRMSNLLSRLGGMRAQTVILEDLNQFNDPGLAILAGRVFEALSRRDTAVIATCYVEPTPKALSSIGQSPGSTVGCPYFSEGESASLVEQHGGDANLWGKLAHVSGAFGHPQLVHAFIAGVAARGWPRSEIPSIIDAGLSTGDITAEREAARRTLIAVLPENSRNLLYRLSMTIGSFNRAAALRIACAPPPIAKAGEMLDALIGPWVEATGRDSYRVSPLAGQSGKDMLLPEQQQAIHYVIASHLIAGTTVDAGDVDKIILHAMLGKNEPVLASLTLKLLPADNQLIGFLAETTVLVGLFETERPIYPDNTYISAMLRLLQLKVLAAGKERRRVEPCVRALMRESESMKRSARDMFQVMSLATVLGTMGIANHLDNWIELLLQFYSVASANELTSKLLKDLETQPGGGNSAVGVLFAIGSSNLNTVARLEHVFERLDRIERAQREMLLTTVGDATPDYSVLVNSPWVAERYDGLDALDAAERYRRMAARTSSWGFRNITIQCWIARAIMLDEYANDLDGALRVLDEATASCGDDVLIDRARAKVFWRARDHKSALSILRRIADVVGKDNNIERAFALREAAISAANCDEWLQAEAWFIESKSSASAAQLPDMHAMAVGLGADAAIAAFNAGQIERCLTGLSEALSALRRIKPASSLQSAHCHHLIRHSILWVQSRLEGRDVILGDAPISMRPGICSNPEPAKEIAEHPLGSIDIAWYMLAESELASRINVGILEGLPARLTEGPIPMLDVGLRLKRLGVEIEEGSSVGFARCLLGHVEGMAYLSNNAAEIRRQTDLLNPRRAAIPSLLTFDVQKLFPSFVDDAVFAFAISCACKGVSERVLELASALDAHFGENSIGGAIFSRARSSGDGPRCTSFEEALIDSVMSFRSDLRGTPQDYFLAGLRFFQQAQRSNFRTGLMPIIAMWQRNTWVRIVASERFQLVQPKRTVPGIEVALSEDADNERFLCSLFLAAAEACGVVLPHDVRALLRDPTS